MEGMGEVCELMVIKWFSRRDARSVRVARERDLLERKSAPVTQHFWTFTIRLV
jgi:hypothetical protein